MNYLFLIILSIFASNAFASSLEKAPVVDADCLGNMSIVERAKTKKSLNQIEKKYLNEAVEIARKLSAEHAIGGQQITSAEIRDLSSFGDKIFGAFVSICDNAEPGQGNCLYVHFKMTNPKYSLTPKVSVVREDYHMGPNKAFLLCE